LDTLELSNQVVRQASQNRVTIVESTDDEAVDVLFQDCLADAIADLTATPQLEEATAG